MESLDERIRRGVGREMTMADIDGLGPYFQPRDAVHAGCRDQDEHLIEVSGLLAKVVPASVIVGGSAGAVAEGLSATLNQFGVGGYWLHLDVDILDPGVMPAVDSPDSGGLGPDQLTELLAVLAPGAVGAQVTVFDPDLDSDGRLAGLLTEILVEAVFGEFRHVLCQPPNREMNELRPASTDSPAPATRVGRPGGQRFLGHAGRR